MQETVFSKSSNYEWLGAVIAVNAPTGSFEPGNGMLVVLYNFYCRPLQLSPGKPGKRVSEWC
jgi:hypothetical protein